MELTNSDVIEFRPRSRNRIISLHDSSSSNKISPPEKRKFLEEECEEEILGVISDEGDGFEVYKDTYDEDEFDDVELSNWDESNNPTPELKVKLMLWK